MTIHRLAFWNFKKSFQDYFSMILSLCFTVLVLFNFLNLTYTDTFVALGEKNKTYIDVIIQVVSFVIGCFMFFFVWYASNVFLNKRKKEIGIYVFMGLTNQKIGKLYLIEMVMVGSTALLLGIGGGIVTTQLFQMILLAISEISVSISFRFQWKPVLLTAGIYAVIYVIFAVKGYRNIVKSSVLDMIQAARQNEYVRTKEWILTGKTVLGILVLSGGYYLAIKANGQNVTKNIFAATVLVIIGIYLIFGGFLPFVFRRLSENKQFLYKKERNLWVNNVIFRMKKNYRTYAMTCVLLLCAVTALATTFATKNRYADMVNFRNTYTYQLVTNRPDIGERAAALIEQDNELQMQSQAAFFLLSGDYISNGWNYGILPFSGVKKLAEDAGLAFPYESIGEDELICANHVILLSLIPGGVKHDVELLGRTFHQIDETREPFLGYLQESQSYYIVSDAAYAQLLLAYEQEVVSPNEQIYVYNYRIKDIDQFEASRDELDILMEEVNASENDYMGRVMIDPNRQDILWVKVEYSMGFFMFLVFVFAGISILFMKLYNDAFEEKERYAILRKMGVSQRRMEKAVAKELGTAYALPFLLMTISSRFAVHALENMMTTSLGLVNLVSVLIIFVLFAAFYLLSLVLYKRNIKG